MKLIKKASSLIWLTARVIGLMWIITSIGLFFGGHYIVWKEESGIEIDAEILEYSLELMFWIQFLLSAIIIWWRWKHIPDNWERPVLLVMPFIIFRIAPALGELLIPAIWISNAFVLWRALMNRANQDQWNVGCMTMEGVLFGLAAIVGTAFAACSDRIELSCPSAMGVATVVVILAVFVNATISGAASLIGARTGE